MRRTLDIVAVLALVGLLVFVLLNPDARNAWLTDLRDPAWWGSAALDWAIFTVVLAYVLLRLEDHLRERREAPYRDWQLVIVGPDGKEERALRLAPDEVRRFEESEYERLKWIKSTVSMYGLLDNVTLERIDGDEGFFRQDARRRTFRLDLERARKLGCFRPHAETGRAGAAVH
jgi:hypothetical protein